MSDEIDDLNEFNNIVEAAAEERGDDDFDDCSDSEPKVAQGYGGDDSSSINAGKYVQYSAFGPGFMPCSRTIKTLRAGIYEIQLTNNGPIFVEMNVVTDDLLRLPDSKSDQVIAEIERFWTLKERFILLGYNHKRGFLLWGPQGSGKTSTVNVVMKQTVEDGGIVFVMGSMQPDIMAMMLARFRQAEPDRHAVVVIEDIDTLIQRYGESEVLAILDGEKSISNVVYIATTNYPERLEPRVVNRPSRFDQVVKIGMPTPEARYTYLKSRKLTLTEKELDKWVEQTEDLSIAHIKELIISVMLYDKTLEESVLRLRTMARTPKSDSSDRKLGFGAQD